MRGIPAIFLFILFSITGYTQVLKGKVTDAASGLPLAGCSVFISGTSAGTTTATDGSFQLSQYPRGKYELVISYVGYNTYVLPLSDVLPAFLQVRLDIKSTELEKVVIETYLEQGWDRWGRVFFENFIGLVPNADQCRIVNTDAIRFRYYRKSNRLHAFAREPIEIVNDALGYRIRFQLEDFELNFTERSVFYLGYSFFQELKGKSTNRKRENRRKAYDGSVLHFMRSLYENRLQEEGFEVRRMTRWPNLEKQRVSQVYRAMAGLNGAAGSIQIPADSAVYYRKVMAQPDFTEIMAPGLLTADSLLKPSDEGLQALHFTQNLVVTYKKAKEENAYLIDMQESRKPAFRRSSATLLEGNRILVDAFGNYFNPRDFLTAGYWAWSEKMANSLPVDYKRE